MPTISAVIIAKNEEKMIANCLDTLQWCDECIVIDNGSTDSTPMLAEQAGAHVIELKNAGFAEARTKGKDEAKSDWILYIDADGKKIALSVFFKRSTSAHGKGKYMNTLLLMV